jgi:hypothetical protein
MPLTNDDYHHILKHFLTYVRKRDEVGYEHLMEFAEIEDQEPRQALLHCIRKYSNTVQPASKGTHGAVLRMLNENIEGEIEGINVILSPGEQELYQRETLDLVPFVDKAKFVDALHRLYKVIESDERGDDDRRRNQKSNY